MRIENRPGLNRETTIENYNLRRGRTISKIPSARSISNPNPNPQPKSMNQTLMKQND
ncbi:hypothetical protein Hanom_Chr02g00146771 [Helianthus anomalus]